MGVARTWDGARGRFYHELGIHSDSEVPYGGPKLNVHMKNGDVLTKCCLRFYNDKEASFYQGSERNIIGASKETVRKIVKVWENGNKIIYQCLPCNTWNAFCEYLSKEFDFPPGLSGHGLEIPDCTFLSKRGVEHKGKLIGYSYKRGKVLVQDEADPDITWDITKFDIAEIWMRGEKVYKDKHLQMLADKYAQR